MPELPALDERPGVSVVMPVRNESSALASSVAAVLESGYGGQLEVVVAVGPSDDGTEEIARGLAHTGQVVVVDNPSGRTPDGLNAAIAAAKHDVIVRMDGHAHMPVGYIDLAVDALRRTGAANVGGRMVPDSPGPFGRAVAVAMASRWGLGGASHRQGGREEASASVYLGSFRREALVEVGGYDPHFVRAQDWELNHRLRRAGYVVWFVPEMAVPYTPRDGWGPLRQQFFASGRWRREVARKHPETRTLRYVAAPAMVVVNASAIVAAGLGAALGAPALGWLLVAPAAYLLGVLGATASLASRTGARAALAMPVVLITMHVAWGVGYLCGVRYSRLDA
ncbi:glycosyltransferase family 2 protein [Demequina muriae]|uniref:4,4'-diaponeurosporenoate glycosyltransferase n=1 Tax=Demequina muriae TaxID=3051664 RepID=A0ABT8GHU7_9MICO|nr:glycosyltransferase family 2 protein [Demequina sp. EGI L300058]MDN4481007.1 glycosyltransferase family 2 protein [Demequina sp. EGI L300058]